MGYEVPDASNTKYDVTFIGDMVALGAADNLAALFPHGIVDCAEGRSINDVSALVADYDGKGVMGGELVLAIGNEEALDKGILESIINQAGAERKVWLINDMCPGAFRDSNNQTLSSLASAHENVELIDWSAAAMGHDDYFGEDGLTLTDAGKAAFAQTVSAAMGDRTQSQAAAEGSADGGQPADGTVDEGA